MRLITSRQFLNTLDYVFGETLRIDPRFAPLRRTDGLLSNGAAVAGTTGSQLEQYQRTAALVAARVVSQDRRPWIMPCTPKSEIQPDQGCAEKFLSDVGQYLYRRPTTKREIADVSRAATEAALRLGGFYDGLAIALEGMLIEPEVLYIAEMSEADPAGRGTVRLDSYSLISRLSFFLWNAGPDDVLLRAARTGEVQTQEGRARIVDYMLESPRLEAGVRAFFDDMFHFDDFDTLAKDPVVYPVFTGLTSADAREQTLRTVVDHLITKKRDYRDLFTTRETFLSPSLAVLYGLPVPDQWSPYEFPADSERAGLLTQVSFLAVHSHPGRSSPTLRGKALREILLCQPVPPPPGNVDFSILENPKANYPTQRDRVTAHLENPVCAGCHKITDPAGLALELFDGSGIYRERENGHPIDANGTLDGKPFAGPRELGEILRDHPALPSCLVQRVYSYAVGGSASAGDKQRLEGLSAVFADSGYSVPALFREIALSPAFAKVHD